MGWEFRKGKRYYYRKERVNGKVVSHYVGTGRIAELWSEIDALDKERRQQEAMERQIARNEFAELAATPKEITLLLEQAQREAARVLTAAGYHQHKRGEWRKRRERKDKDQEQGTDS